MSKSLKDEWKETGKDLGKAFENLGKSIFNSGKHALRNVDAWASNDNKKDNNSGNNKQ